MQPIDAGHFGSLLTEVSECYDRKPVSPAAQKMWFDSLTEYPFSMVSQVLRTWVKSKNKLPTVAEIAGICSERAIEQREERSTREKAQERGELMQTMRSNSPEAERLRNVIRGMLKGDKPAPYFDAGRKEF